MGNQTATAPTITDIRSRSATRAARKIGTLLVRDSHRDGFVSQLAPVLNRHGACILDSDQYSDEVEGLFLQRVQFDLSELTCDRTTLERSLGDLGRRLGAEWRISYPDRLRRIALMVSKQDHCLYDLLIRHRGGELPCEISMVVSNHADAAPIARHFDIPFHHLPVTPETRDKQEVAVMQLLDSARIDLVVLARYMQILSPRFVAHYPQRIINIHHSFLPAFIGANPYRQAHVRGVKMIGATSHYVTAELDQGPIIEQSVVRCSHRDTVEDLVRKGRDLERNVLAAAVRGHLEDRVLAYDGKTVVFE